MSHKGPRKSQSATLTEEKEKRHTDSPVKEMKKKIAANAEKEKAVDKPDKTAKTPEKTDKNSEKPEKIPEKTPSEKPDKKVQNSDKVEKNPQTADKNAQKHEKADKNAEKNNKNDEKADKKTEKVVDKKNEAEKKEEGKDTTNAKDTQKPLQNGANGDTNGDTVSEADSEDDLLVIDDHDEVFPELTYDDTSDPDFEEGAPSRSFTRRSQVKATKTPETPRPASGKEDESKEKLLKMTDPLASDRKLRSADSPKPESKKEGKVHDSPKKDVTIDLTEDKESDTTGNQLEMEVSVEVENIEGEPRGKTRARVSPFSSRAPPSAPAAAPAAPVPAPATAPAPTPAPVSRHDVTTTSMMANYTGNNTTMEMDISDTSLVSESLDDSGYLRGLRAIRGRASYKPLKQLAARHTHNTSVRSSTSLASAASANTSLTDTGRPTGTVVGRKRKPDADGPVELAAEALDVSEAPRAAGGSGALAGSFGASAGSSGGSGAAEELHGQSKRMRLLERLSEPFRGLTTRRAAEIVGINTDLPLTVPIASTSSFDPEALKPSPSPSDPIAVPLPPPAHDRDNKRCVLM